MRQVPSFILRVVCVVFCLAPLASRSEAAVSFEVVNRDSAGEGFNDPTAIDSIGGNAATSLGEARLEALRFALAILADALDSPVTVRVGVRFDPLGGSATAAVLGMGGSSSVFRDFAGAPHAGTWYKAPLADRLAGMDLEPGELDLELIFNSDVDGPVVLGDAGFYYGFDAAAGDSNADFVTVALHELAHGLGFATQVDRATGAKLLGYDDAYMRHLEHHGASPSDFPSMTDAQRQDAIVAGGALHWVGSAGLSAGGILTAGVSPEGHLAMFAPDPPSSSSLSHLAIEAEPDELMEPFHNGAHLDLGLVLGMLQDVGWGVAPICEPLALP